MPIEMSTLTLNIRALLTNRCRSESSCYTNGFNSTDPDIDGIIIDIDDEEYNVDSFLYDD